MRNINTDYLRTFDLYVYNGLDADATAEMLGINRRNVYRHIDRLEEAIGVPLLMKGENGRFASVSLVGSVLLDSWHQLEERVGALVEAVT